MRLRIFSLPVSIERLQAGDNNGQPTVQATLVSACWAKLEAVSHQRLSSPEDSPALTHRLTIRLRQPVTSDCRVRATDGRRVSMRLSARRSPCISPRNSFIQRARQRLRHHEFIDAGN